MPSTHLNHLAEGGATLQGSRRTPPRAIPVWPVCIGPVPLPHTQTVLAMQQSALNPPVSVLILHHGEMALHSQQHLHVSRHRVVEKGIGMPLGQLQSLLKKEVICKAMSTTTAESRSPPLHAWQGTSF